LIAQFLDLCEAPEALLGCAPGLFRGHPAADVLLGAHVEVEAHLLIDLAVHGVAITQSPQPI